MCHANSERHMPKYRYALFTPFNVMFLRFRVRERSESRRETSQPQWDLSKRDPATSAQYVGGLYVTFFQNSRSRICGGEVCGSWVSRASGVRAGSVRRKRARAGPS